MGRRTRECYLCGKKYNYCPTCSQDRTKPSWMTEFHEENCVKIFEICTRFNMKKMSKEEARSALSSCDLTNKENFKSYVQRDLENIFAEEPKAKRGKRAEALIIDEVMVEPKPVEESHEVVTIENE